MTISLQRATIEDAHELAVCVAEASRDDPLRNAIFGTYQDHREAEIEFRKRNISPALARNDLHYVKAVDETDGSIVGFTCWAEPEKPAPQNSPAPTDKKAEHDRLAAEFPGINLEVMRSAQAKAEGLKKEVVRDSVDYWYVRAMAVRPAYQRQGIGQRLVQRGLQIVSELGSADVYLLASEAAVALYERNSFQPLESTELTEGRKTTAMVRRAKSIT